MNKRTKKMLPKNLLRASINESSVSDESRTVDLTWTTGSKGLRHSWGGSYYEELSLDPSHVDLSRLNDGGHPLLAAHNDRDLDSVVGVVEKVWLEGDKAGATVRFAKDDISDRVFQKVKDKILRNVSVGYSVEEYTDVTRDGDEYPTYRATRWTPAEISIVPIGFDKDAKVRKQEVNNENEVEIISRSEDIQEISAMTDEQKKALALEAAAAERTRGLEIRKIVKEAKLDDKMADEYVNNGTSSEEVRTNVALFAKYAKEQEATQITTAVSVEVGTENAEAKREGFEQALLTRIDSKNFQHTEASKEFYGKGLLRQIEALIPRHRMESDVAYAKRAMSSSDLPLALANVAEKGLQKQYELQPRTFSRWTRSDSLNNYKEYSQVKAGDRASLLERPEGADALESSFGEKNEVAQLKDYARIVSFTSQMLVNDDMGVISRLASSGGISVARLENSKAYSALTTNKNMKDGVALYHATHANLAAAAAINETSVAEAYKLMRKQSSTDGLDKLNLAPKYFICGPDKEVEARKFFAQIIPNQTSNVNIFQGSMEVIVDAELTGNQHYFLADPNLIDTVVCFRLAGQEQPKIESRVKFENSSLQLKIDHAFAAEPMDWRGIVKNAGA